MTERRLDPLELLVDAVRVVDRRLGRAACPDRKCRADGHYEKNENNGQDRHVRLPGWVGHAVTAPSRGAPSDCVKDILSIGS